MCFGVLQACVPAGSFKFVSPWCPANLRTHGGFQICFPEGFFKYVCPVGSFKPAFLSGPSSLGSCWVFQIGVLAGSFKCVVVVVVVLVCVLVLVVIPIVFVVDDDVADV